MDDSEATADAIFERALALAIRAPSAHNTQPWLWRQSGTVADLFVDTELVLRRSDPDGRNSLLSVGAALHHLQVGLAAEGRRAEIDRFPRAFDRTHVARIEFASPHTPTDDDRRLAEAIGRRRSDRRGYDTQSVSSDLMSDLLSHASRHDVIAVNVNDETRRSCLVRAARAAAAVHAEDLDYQLELASWSGTRVSDEGVSASNVVRSRPDAELPARVYATRGPDTDVDSGAVGELILIASELDDRTAQLRAGEALSELLLAATRSGLAVCPVTEPLEIAPLRREIMVEVLDDKAYPQVGVRVGWPIPGSTELPPTRRRPTDDVLVHDGA
ncbi:Acg family FMN-binding oxidoreductase [Gordonia sp. NPDC003424]